MKKADWLLGCEICNTGLCKRIDELKDQDKTVREAARIMESESDGLWDAEKIRDRYRYYKGGKSGGKTPREGARAEDIAEFERQEGEKQKEFKKRWEEKRVRENKEHEEKRRAYNEMLANETPEERKAREDQESRWEETARRESAAYFKELGWLFGVQDNGIAGEIVDLLPEKDRPSFLKNLYILASKYLHPDKGGSTEKMQKLNELWEQFTKAAIN